MLFARTGVPPACKGDNAKEKVQGKFYQKLKDTKSYLKQLEPYISPSNAAEREIKKLKKGVGHKLLRSKAPKWLWDDCLELDAYIRSNTAHDIYKQDRKYPNSDVRQNIRY